MVQQVPAYSKNRFSVIQNFIFLSVFFFLEDGGGGGDSHDQKVWSGSLSLHVHVLQINLHVWYVNWMYRVFHQWVNTLVSCKMSLLVTYPVIRLISPLLHNIVLSPHVTIIEDNVEFKYNYIDLITLYSGISLTSPHSPKSTILSHRTKNVMV